MIEPKISVIIPIYNTGTYLEETLNSILNQTIIDDIEVLMIDDGSTDESRYIIERFALDYDNFHAFHKENEGQGIARNYGLERANGEYIHFMDSDDYIVSDAYEKMYNSAKIKNYDFVVVNSLRFGKYNLWEDQLFENSFNGLNENKEFNNINDYPLLVWDTAIWNKLYRKDFLEINNIVFPNKKILYEDLIFSLEAYIKGNSFYFLNEYVYYWRSRNDLSSITQQNKNIKNFKDRLKIINYQKELIAKYDLNDKIYDVLYYKWFNQDIGLFLKNFNVFSSNYHYELINDILGIIEDLPNIQKRLNSYFKVIYKMVEKKDVEGLIYFSNLYNQLKENPNLKLDLNEDYLKLIDFNKDIINEKLIVNITDIDYDENNIYISFESKINYLSDNFQNKVKAILIDEKNNELNLEIKNNQIILPLDELTTRKYCFILIECNEEHFFKKSYLKNYARKSIIYKNFDIEMCIGVNNYFNINIRDININPIEINKIDFDGENFLFTGLIESEIDEVYIENVINFKQLKYPLNYQHDENIFYFKINIKDLLNQPIKKWELKCNNFIKLSKSFSFFREFNEIYFSNRRNKILIEINVYNKLEKLNELNNKCEDIFKINNSLLSNNKKLNKKNLKLKDKNKNLKDINKKLKEKNNSLNHTIKEFKSRKIIKLADMFKIK